MDAFVEAAEAVGGEGRGVIGASNELAVAAVAVLNRPESSRACSSRDGVRLSSSSSSEELPEDEDEADRELASASSCRLRAVDRRKKDCRRVGLDVEAFAGPELLAKVEFARLRVDGVEGRVGRGEGACV